MFVSPLLCGSHGTYHKLHFAVEILNVRRLRVVIKVRVNNRCSRFLFPPLEIRLNMNFHKLLDGLVSHDR
jgi:hypothetical protein